MQAAAPSVRYEAPAIGSCIFLSSNTSAEVVNQTQWRVQSGDTLYGIARKLYPNNSELQRRLRRELVESNLELLQGNANNLSIGQVLTLPAFAVQTEPLKAKPVVAAKKPLETSRTQAVEVTKPPEGDPAEVVGQVLVNLGNTMASNRGSTRNLSRRSRIYKGDTLITDEGARAQIRMKDGALIALRPNSELRLVNYEYYGREDGRERSLLELLRGGFRSITGAIGRTNKQNYKVTTTTATIGIRGTHYGLMLCSGGGCQQTDQLPDGLYGGVVDGAIVAENSRGQFTFNNDEYFHIASASDVPVQTLIPPPIFNDKFVIGTDDDSNKDQENRRPEQRVRTEQARENGQQRPNRSPGRADAAFHGMIGAMSNNNRDPRRLLTPEDINSTNLEPPLPPKAPSGAGMALSLTLLDTNGRVGTGVPIYVTDQNSNNIFLENFTLPNGNIVANLPFALHEQSIGPNGALQQHEANRILPDGSGATYANLGGDGGLGVNWGRWQGNFILRENGQPVPHDQNMHFIYSPNLTPLSNLFNLGGLRSRIELYTYAGGTLATNHQGIVALNPPEILIDVDFVNHELRGYSVKTLVDNLDWYGQLYNPVNFGQLSESFDISGDCHGILCNGQASLMFVGSGAGGAMTSYSLTDTLQQGISGAALLTASQLPTTPDNFAALFAFRDSIGTGGDAFPVLTHPGSEDNIYTFSQTPVIAADEFTDSGGISRYQRIMIDPSQASLLDPGNDTTSIAGTTVNWGRWDAGNLHKESGTQGITDVAFIQSDNLTTPTQLGGLTGTANYTTVAGSYNASYNGLPAAGGTVTMDVNFDTNLVTSFTANAFESVNTLGGTAANIPFQDLSQGFQLTNGGGCNVGTCSGSASAAFVGNAAQGAITSFNIESTTGDTAVGTALIKR